MKHLLSLHSTAPVDELAWPIESEEINTNSNALSVFTDFKKIKPSIVDKEISATEAETLMEKSHVDIMVVVDQNNAFLGIVSLEILNKQEIIIKINDGYRRDELKLTDFYQAKESLKAFDFDELSHSTVGDVINTLKTYHQQHCLVIEQKSHQIRGVISASEIARQLKMDIDLSCESSFIGIFNTLHH